VVTPSLAKHQTSSYGTAKRLRHNVESVPHSVMIVPNTVTMMTVACDDCGARFAVAHRLAFQDVHLAERQAIWLKDQFVWHHIQEDKHPGSIPLPGAHEMKTSE
jgi:hypothetical protein